MTDSAFSRVKARLKGRYRSFRITRYIFYITIFWFVSIFLAPLSLESGTVEELDANANWIDHGSEWADMARYNPYAATIYLIGDFNCHQKASRSLFVNDNELPVCARDVGIAGGGVIGALILFFVIRTPYMFLTFLSVIPERFRNPMLKRLPPWVVAGLVAFPLLLPTGFDGFYQLFTSYESTNTVRLVTGFFLGVLLSWGFGSAFLSVTIPLPMLNPEDEKKLLEKLTAEGFSKTTTFPTHSTTPSPTSPDTTTPPPTDTTTTSTSSAITNPTASPSDTTNTSTPSAATTPTNPSVPANSTVTSSATTTTSPAESKTSPSPPEQTTEATGDQKETKEIEG